MLTSDVRKTFGSRQASGRLRGSMLRYNRRSVTETARSVASSSAKVIFLAPRRSREATWRCTGWFQRL